MEANFSLDDSQLLPGLTDMNKDIDLSRRMVVLQNIIHSMTPQERQRPDRLTPSRCRRISKGSGIPWELQGQVLREYFRAKEVAEEMNRLSMMQKMKHLMRLSQVEPMIDDFDDDDDDDDDDLD
jgi:signal recognition particle subunit SRP54